MSTRMHMKRLWNRIRTSGSRNCVPMAFTAESCPNKSLLYCCCTYCGPVFSPTYVCTSVKRLLYVCVYVYLLVCVCVFYSHLLWTSSLLDVPVGVTQDFSSTFFLRCVLYFLWREGFSHSFPSLTVKSNLCTNDLIVLHSLGIFIFCFLILTEKNVAFRRKALFVNGLSGFVKVAGM